MKRETMNHNWPIVLLLGWIASRGTSYRRTKATSWAIGASRARGNSAKWKLPNQNSYHWIGNEWPERGITKTSCTMWKAGKRIAQHGRETGRCTTQFGHGSRGTQRNERQWKEVSSIGGCQITSRIATTISTFFLSFHTFCGWITRYLAEKLAAEDLMIELGREVERLRSETGPALPTTSPEALRLEELHQELEDLRQTNKSLIEQNEELQAMMLTRGVEEGRNLLNGTSNSLAQELGELNERQVILHTERFHWTQKEFYHCIDKLIHTETRTQYANAYSSIVNSKLHLPNRIVAPTCRDL